MIDEHDIKYTFHKYLGDVCGDGYADSLHEKAAREACVAECVEAGVQKSNAEKFVNKCLRGEKRNLAIHIENQQRAKI